MQEELKKPSDRLTIKVSGEDRELFMSAGLLNKLVKIVAANAEDFAAIYLDPTIQEYCIKQTLVKRNEYGKPEVDVDEVDLMYFEMSVDDSKKLVSWMGDHVVDFFIVGATSMKNGVSAQEKVLMEMTEDLTRLEDGLKASQ